MVSTLKELMTLARAQRLRQREIRARNQRQGREEAGERQPKANTTHPPEAIRLSELRVKDRPKKV